MILEIFQITVRLIPSVELTNTDLNRQIYMYFGVLPPYQLINAYKMYW